MRALFIILPEKGHINPYIRPAQALQDMGVEVSIAAPGDINRQIESAGLRFVDDLVTVKALEIPMRGKGLVDLVKDQNAMKEWIKSLLLTVKEEEVSSVRLFLRRQSPDVVILDPLYYAAVIATIQEEIPWVSLSNSLNPVLEEDVTSDLLSTLREVEDQRTQLFRDFGIAMNFRGCDALSEYLTIAFCTEAFVGIRSGVKMVGPSLPLRGRGDELAILKKPLQRIIYASFGSQIYHWPEIFQKLIEATLGLDVHLVLSIGDIELPYVPDHVTCYSYAPQLELLKQTDLFITHGGANSIMEALALGCSRLWVTPMCNDQFHQAHYIEKSGIGISRDIQTMSAEEIRTTIKDFMEDDDMKERMRKIGESYQVNGSQAAARLIKELIC